MVRTCRVAALAAGLVGLVVATDPCGAQGQKDPSIKEIMTKAHKGGDSLLARVGKELQADEPDWAGGLDHGFEQYLLPTSSNWLFVHVASPWAGFPLNRHGSAPYRGVATHPHQEPSRVYLPS